ncbi:hypothetical protein N7456_013178 [Penicillium angulare]|uniref:CCZ1/INTU/HSP4 first Longin domain-containing protein n=1 Tax=Penicillium angulare TaxID=116970 RepID=A0A9W9EKY8_9EURO|nr:hypothetical protein N7456_013178 [Penicillium angulare]
MPESDTVSVIPAQLSFLSIYNPTLGPTDETIEDQIVFYTSKSDYLQRTEGSSDDVEDGKPSEEGKNGRLRQIGLAQGMVHFASNFSPEQTLEYVETEKTRVVLLELEKDWWLVASIDLTRLPTEQPQSPSNNLPNAPNFQYSAREMGHPHLLIQQLRRAHSIFLLLHDLSLGGLYERVGRGSLCLFLERFWEKFAWNWELLLTGNPIVDVYNGIKLAAGGELGIGVGEEEWGSGEREVLEDFVTRTDGLVDLVVSRFGESSKPPGDALAAPEYNDENSWLGLDIDPRPADGVIFSGINSVSRRSVARVSHWMEWIYRYGDKAYGIGRDPTSLRRRKPRRHRFPSRARNSSSRPDGAHPSSPERSHTPGIPRPLVIAAPQSIPDTHEGNDSKQDNDHSASDPKSDAMPFGTDTVMKYLTLGYGSAWSLSSLSTPSPAGSPAHVSEVDNPPTGIAEQNDHVTSVPQPPSTPTPKKNNGTKDASKEHVSGRFVLGPRDDLDTLDDLEETSPASESDLSKRKTQIVQRALHLQLAGRSSDEGESRKLQAVIYVHQPFMFTFLFDAETAPISSPSLYSSIHHQLGPLQKPLLSSTSPTTAATRISADPATDPKKHFSAQSQPAFDLVYDPSNLTIRCSIPNVPRLISFSQSPEIGHSPRTPSPSPTRPQTTQQWSRIESLAIHHRLLTTYMDTRSRPQELERTCKTSRGWWVLWVRIPQSTTFSPKPQALSSVSSSVALSSLDQTEAESSPLCTLIPAPSSRPQEAFLVRKASDYVSPASHGRMSSGARFFRDLGGASSKFSIARAEATPSKLVEGIGLDARRYVEGLLRFNR